MILRVERSIYGLPEAGILWFKTYHEYHNKTLKLKPATHDNCLLYTPGILSPNRPPSSAVTCLQTDDTLSVGTKQFKDMEDQKVKTFRNKPSEILKPGSSITFNGELITHNNDQLLLSQPLHAEKLKLLNIKTFSKEDYVSERANGAYIATMSRPDLAFGLSKCAQVQDPKQEHAKELNAILLNIKANPNNGLKYLKVVSTTTLMVFADASFASNEDGTSQLGFIITMTDKDGLSNILHYSSIKSRRVTRSVLAAELYAMSHAFDIASTLKLTLSEIYGRKISMVMCTDSKSLFHLLVGITPPTEKRLLRDLKGLREAYEVREIDETIWIPSENNPADGLTKNKNCDALVNLIEEGKVNVTPNSWVKRAEDGNKEKETKNWKGPSVEICRTFQNFSLQDHTAESISFFKYHDGY